MSLLKYTTTIVLATICILFFTHKTTFAQQVTGFTLINASTNEELGDLNDGDVINLALLPSRELNIRANTNPAKVASLVFDLNGKTRFRVESVAPYALAGDLGGLYKSWTPPLGTNNLTAKIYSASSGAGSILNSLSITFTVIDDPNPAPDPTPTPDPEPTPTDPCTLPTVWSSQDIGNVEIAGDVCYENGSYTVNASGKDIWNVSDAFHFVSQSSDCDTRTEIIAKVESIGNTHIWAKAGVMIRESNAPNAKHAMMIITPSMGASFQYRPETGALTKAARTSGAAPQYVRLVRNGNTFSGFVSNTKGSWIPVGQATISMGANVQVGLAVTSHNSPVSTQAVFSEVSIDCESTPDPIPTPEPSAMVLKMVNAQTNQVFANALKNGEVITTDQLSAFNIIADNVPQGTKSVAFTVLSGPFVNEKRTENTAPYTLFGNEGSNYLPRPAENGTTHVIAAKAYSGAGASGVLLASIELSFSFEGSTPTPIEPSVSFIAPNPNQVYTIGENIALQAQVDNLGNNKVQFVKAGELLNSYTGGDGIYAFTFNSAFIKNPPKTPVFTVRIVNNLGQTLAEDQVQVAVNPENTDPNPNPDPDPDPDPTPAPSPNPSGEIWMEAECADFVGAAWTIENDPKASGGKALVVPEGTDRGRFLRNAPTDAQFHIIFNVNIPEDGNYHIYMRERAAFDSDHGSNSIYRGVNNSEPANWGKQTDLTKKGEFRWRELKQDRAYFLKAGINKIYFGLREDGVRLDKIFLKKDVDVDLGLDEVGIIGSNCGLDDPLEDPIPDNPVAQITGELKTWHKVTLSFNGPQASETASNNPFTNYRMNVTFAKGNKFYTVPGYFAADGNAGESSANSGNIWRVHFAPDEEGIWNYFVSFREGTNIAVSDNPLAGTPVAFDGASGTLNIGPTDKKGRDFRGKGRLQYVGEHYLKFAETQEYFIKVGADAPETLFAYEDFDNTYRHDNGTPLKKFDPHKGDWKSGDPTWKGGKGKGLIGAINYLSNKGNNVFSFLTYNAGGDGKNVWPFIAHTERLRYDCSKLDQWEIIFEHADKMGMYLHFKTQERENDRGTWGLDAGELGLERRLYYRELIARFGHHLALNWNLGEENKQTTEQRKQMAQYFYDHDPYRHHVVVHNFTNEEEKVYQPLLGNNSKLTGISYQMDYAKVHALTLEWLAKSANAGKKWVVANDEQNPASYGVPPDDGWPKYTYIEGTPTQKDIRHRCLWGNLMAGGAGVEYYFGYRYPQTDLNAQNWRSRDNMWDYNRFAKEFFLNYLPFWEMKNHDNLTAANNDYCFAKLGDTYAIYLPNGGTNTLDVTGYDGSYSIMWYNPRTGETWQDDNQTSASGKVKIGEPPYQENADWAVLLVRDNHFFSLQNSANLTAHNEQVAYPNPASTYVNFVVELSQPGDVQLTLTNMTEVVLNRTFTNVGIGKQVVSIQVSNYPDGLYNYTLRYEGKEIRNSLIIQR